MKQSPSLFQCTNSHETDLRVKHCLEIAVIGALIGIQNDDLSEDVKEWMLQTLAEIKHDFSVLSPTPCFDDNNPPCADIDLLNHTERNDSSTPLSIGQRIRQERKSASLQQHHIASATGVTIQAVSLWENDLTIPTCDKIIPLSNALGCDPLWLLTGNNTKVAA
ncbi:helix-turn-helix domain-containing protein [Klebsiella sp. NPDC088457]